MMIVIFRLFPTLKVSMMFLVATRETPLSPTPFSIYLNIRTLIFSCTCFTIFSRMFLAVSVFLASRLFFMSRDVLEIGEEEVLVEGSSSW